MRKGLGFVLAGVAVGALGLAGGGWWAAGRPIPDVVAAHLHTEKRAAKPERQEQPLVVKVVPAERRPVPVAFEYTGTIVSSNDAALQARVSGKVIERTFEPGGHVTKGQPLFRIDPRPFEVALKSARAQQAQARAALDFAQAEAERTKQLVGKGYASEQRNEQNQSNLAGAEARLAEAEAAIARQELNLNYAEVNAPFDGRASLSLVNTGDMAIENQTHLVSVVEVDPIDVQMALSSQDVEAVRGAMEAGEVKVQILDERRAPVRDAVIYRLDNRFDPRTARRLVQARVENRDERFLPGQFVRARVQVGQQERLLVPTIALSAQLDQQVVWTVDAQDTVHMTPIETGDAFGEQTAVLSGLTPDTRIVVDHLQSMRQNLKVAPRTGGAARSESARAEGEARH